MVASGSGDVPLLPPLGPALRPDLSQPGMGVSHQSPMLLRGGGMCPFCPLGSGTEA